MSKARSSFRVHPDFKRLFLRKEGRELLGPGRRNLWVLVGIMFVTFTAIGFANGSLQYLRQKMANPFINWVNIEVPYGKNDQIRSIEAELNQAGMRERFHYGPITGSTGESLPIFDQQRKGAKNARGRTLAHDSPLLEKIMESYVAGRKQGFAGPYDFGLIVTRDFLKRFGYPEDARFISLSFSVEIPDSLDSSPGSSRTEEVLTPLPLAAVVEELPDLRDFVCTPYFEGNYAHSTSGNPFHPDNLQHEIHFVLPSEDQAYEMKEVLLEALPRLDNPNGSSLFAMEPEQLPDLTYDTLWRVGINFLDNIHRREMDDLLGKLEALPAWEPFLGTYTRIYAYELSQQYDPYNYDFLSVNFNRLDQVRAFRDTLLSISEIEIDIAQVESKENFNYVSKLTRIISLVLIALSVLGICLFVSHIFQRHLEKIRRNLGTFKAFGLDDSTLIGTYLRLMGMFLLAAMAMALLLSALFGYLGGMRALLSVLQLSLEPSQSYYQLLDGYTFLAIGLVIGVGMWVLYRTARRILSRTPGDLINNRG
jgi:hypothetical protein